MNMQKKVLQAGALVLGATLGLSALSGCGGDIPDNKDALVIMTEELNGLYNPFYATAGTDMDVVGQTQISMLSTDTDGEIACGEDEPTAVLDYEIKPGANDTTEYYFVIKNGIKFSDGVHPLTMNDILFNMYVYLDPAYTGSTTMYSTDIVGLQTYRQQQYLSDSEEGEDNLTIDANRMAQNRANELIQLFESTGQVAGSPGNYSATESDMEEAIKLHEPSAGYYEAIGVDPAEDNAIGLAQEQLLTDYHDTLTRFREELESDYRGAKDSYTEEPYKSAPVYYSNSQVATGFDEIVSFMFAEGYVELEYPQEAGQAPDKSQIKRANLNYNYNNVKTQADAISYVYRAVVQTAFNQVLRYWATGTQMRTDFAAKAKDIILHGRLEGDGLSYPNISGIESLGHTSDLEQVTVHGKTYEIAKDHNPDGTPTDTSKHDVLRVTINGVDPKAIWNFGFTIAPHYYYSDPDLKSAAAKEHNAKEGNTPWDLTVDIEANKFGVAWADFDFQTKILQGNTENGISKNKVPVGAGPYVATDRNNTKDLPTGEAFFENSIVYYRANENFMMGKPKIDKMQYMVTSTSNALSSLKSGQVHFVTPQFTKENSREINDLSGKGVASVSTWQLGYGYIGINASKVKQLELRKAIMSAMNTQLALEYYNSGTAVNISWPMSAVSWAYPRTNGAEYNGAYPTENMLADNGKDYMTWRGDEAAKTKIRNYMEAATYTQADLEVEFTIAGANMNEHPVFQVFKHAMELLNECGWNVTVKPDATALVKLSTGSLAVWAAAWGSTIDPDMYQVYHKNSTATSVLAWGYPTILTDSSNEYNDERAILNSLAKLIDDARETDNKQTRTALYKDAMSYVLDLAVEMPVYQRQTLYAYNSEVIDESTLPHDKDGKLACNSYTSPLSRIWEVDFVK